MISVIYVNLDRRVVMHTGSSFSEKSVFRLCRSKERTGAEKRK